MTTFINYRDLPALTYMEYDKTWITTISSGDTPNVFQTTLDDLREVLLASGDSNLVVNSLGTSPGYEIDSIGTIEHAQTTPPEGFNYALSEQPDAEQIWAGDSIRVGGQISVVIAVNTLTLELTLEDDLNLPTTSVFVIITSALKVNYGRDSVLMAAREDGVYIQDLIVKDTLSTDEIHSKASDIQMNSHVQLNNGVLSTEPRGAYCYAQFGQTIPSSTWIRLDWFPQDVERNYYSELSSGPTLFTASVAGWYSIYLSVRLGDLPDGGVQLVVARGTDYNQIDYRHYLNAVTTMFFKPVISLNYEKYFLVGQSISFWIQCNLASYGNDLADVTLSIKAVI
jgi:hypothetical protein